MLSRAARGTTTRPGRYKRYSPKEYPRYDNYNAIEVGRYTDIPYDFDGAMGVPITFLDKYKADVGATASRPGCGADARRKVLCHASEAEARGGL